MAKDALGHGSNGKLDVNGRSIIPSRPYREGTDQQMALAEKHGVPTDHLVNKFSLDPAQGPTNGFGFGKRGKPPIDAPLAAHQSRIGQLVKDFVKSETGAGRAPEFRDQAYAQRGDWREVARNIQDQRRGHTS